MLERPDLVRSPIALSKVVELLQAMLSPQLDPRRRALGGAVPQPSVIATAERAQKCSPSLRLCWSSADVACMVCCMRAICSLVPFA